MMIQNRQQIVLVLPLPHGLTFSLSLRRAAVYNRRVYWMSLGVEDVATSCKSTSLKRFNPVARMSCPNSYLNDFHSNLNIRTRLFKKSRMCSNSNIQKNRFFRKHEKLLVVKVFPTIPGSKDAKLAETKTE